MTSPIPLRERLTAVMPAVPSTCPDPQCGDSTWDHDCELGADFPNTRLISATLVVFRDWLREQATADLMAAETTEFHWLQIDAEQCVCGEWREDETGVIHDRHVARAGLAFLASAIDEELVATYVAGEIWPPLAAAFGVETGETP